MPLSIVFPISMGGEESVGIQSHANSNTTAAIKQNMKMLLLTRKGEYVWDPAFGIGLHDYLFENDVTISTEIQKVKSEARLVSTCRMFRSTTLTCF